MKILVITRSAWDDTNSIGNTITNLFMGYDKNKIANLYVRSEEPNNKVCNKYFSISDKAVFKSIIKFKHSAGVYFFKNIGSFKESQQNIAAKETVEEKLVKYFRTRPSAFALFLQDLLWKIGKWQSVNLDNFLDDFKPDIIFSPSFHTCYTHRILWYLKEKTNARLALFHADDYLSINENSNLLNKFYEKKRVETVTKSILMADINYCISHKQQEEYQKKIGKDMKLLYKGAFFSEKPFYKSPEKGTKIKIVYIGSTLYGRWRNLSLLAEKIKKINESCNYFELVIYSQYELKKEIKRKMIIDGASKFMGKIPASQIKNKYRETDIVLHTESFDPIEKQRTRLSFSTKILDCLHSGRAIMAIGWEEAASIEYLKENDAALIASNEVDLEKLLIKILDRPNLLIEYSDKAWECGKKNHQIEEIQKIFFDDLKNL